MSGRRANGPSSLGTTYPRLQGLLLQQENQCVVGEQQDRGVCHFWPAETGMEVELPELCVVGPDEGGHPQQPACTEPPGAAMDLPGWAPLLGSTCTLAFSALWSPFPGGGGMVRLRVEGEIGHSVGPWLPYSNLLRWPFLPTVPPGPNQESPLCVPSAPSPAVGLVMLFSCSSASPVRWGEPSALHVGPRAS